MEHHFLDHFRGKIRSIGTSEKVVLFPRRNVPNENSSSMSLKPSLIPVSGFDGTQICIERFSLDCRKGLVLVLVLLRPLVG